MCDIFKHFLKFRMQKKSFISPNKDIRVWMHAQYLLHHGHTCSWCVYCGESALPHVLLDIQILKQTTVRRLHQPPLRHTGLPATRTHMIKKTFPFLFHLFSLMVPLNVLSPHSSAKVFLVIVTILNSITREA